MVIMAQSLFDGVIDKAGVLENKLIPSEFFSIKTPLEKSFSLIGFR